MRRGRPRVRRRGHAHRLSICRAGSPSRSPSASPPRSPAQLGPGHVGDTEQWYVADAAGAMPVCASSRSPRSRGSAPISGTSASPAVLRSASPSRSRGHGTRGGAPSSVAPATRTTCRARAPCVHDGHTMCGPVPVLLDS
ncbi:hypothetical protein CU044_1654 [Streptomyces sp. L-9-10]|nr:hypothetical protein CU044_1654 [Streptomyces sp. L-9-10]